MVIKTFAILTYMTTSHNGYQALNVERFDNLNECLAVIEYYKSKTIPYGLFNSDVAIEKIVRNLECKELEYATNE